jgi:hypothetical protein
VLDNGVPQTVDYISFDEWPLNVVLAFDVSGSMAGPGSTTCATPAMPAVDQLKADDRAAFVSFSHAVSVGSDLTGDRSRGGPHGDQTERATGGQTSVVDGASRA